MRVTFVFLVFILLIPALGFAQVTKIMGTVRDGSSKEAIPLCERSDSRYYHWHSDRF